MSYCRDIKPTLDTTLDADVNVDADGDEFSKFQLERNLITTVFITVLFSWSCDQPGGVLFEQLRTESSPGSTESTKRTHCLALASGSG